MSRIDFDELTPGATVRFTVIDGIQYLSVRDLIMALCNQNNKHASTTWANLADERKSEISKFLRNLKFSGPGQKDQPVITFPGALKLMMWLPGEHAKQMRSKAIEILLNNFAGDPSDLNPTQNTPCINEAPESSMNFDELIPGFTVRFTVKGGIQYLSIRDLIMAISKKDANQASEMWRRLAPEFKEEVKACLFNFKFPGPGQKDQPVITFPGALKLMMWLPGENAKQMRSKAAEILTRYYAGDPSLLKDIEANAQSASPICQAARAALQQPNLEQALEDVGFSEQFLVKRRRLTEEFTGSIEVSSTKVRQYTADLSECNAVFEKHIELKERSNSVDIKFEHDKLTVERAKLSLLKRTQKQELEYKRALQALGTADVPETTTVLKVYEMNRSQFKHLNEPKRNLFLQRAGTLAAQKYREQTGTYPLRYQEGRVEVNAYPLNAEPMILETLRTVYRQTMAGFSQPSIFTVFAHSRASD
jgi:hypothetical protein